MAKKTSKKVVSEQVKGKLSVKKDITKLMEQLGYEVVDCGNPDTAIEGATKFTLYVRLPNSDVMIKIISRPDNKSPFYDEVSEVLEAVEEVTEEQD